MRDPSGRRVILATCRLLIGRQRVHQYPAGPQSDWSPAVGRQSFPARGQIVVDSYSVEFCRMLDHTVIHDPVNRTVIAGVSNVTLTIF